MSRLIVLLVICLAMGTTVKAQNCEICESVVGAIESWVEANATVDQIEQALDQFCTYVPAFQAVCDQLVQTGISTIVSWIENNENPTEICTQLGFCGNKYKPKPKVFLSQIPAKLIKPVGLPGDAVCDSCEQVIGLIENWLSNSNTESQIESYLEAFCQYVPGFEQTCDAIAQAGVPAVINWIIQNENDTVVCAQLGLCSSKKVMIKPTINEANCVADPCDECAALVGLVDGWLSDSANVNSVGNLLEKNVCPLLPSNFKDDCALLTCGALPPVINWLSQNVPPEKVCAYSGLCCRDSSAKRDCAHSSQKFKLNSHMKPLTRIAKIAKATKRAMIN